MKNAALLLFSILLVNNNYASAGSVPGDAEIRECTAIHRVVNGETGESEMTDINAACRNVLPRYIRHVEFNSPTVLSVNTKITERNERPIPGHYDSFRELDSNTRIYNIRFANHADAQRYKDDLESGEIFRIEVFGDFRHPEHEESFGNVTDTVSLDWRHAYAGRH